MVREEYGWDQLEPREAAVRGVVQLADPSRPLPIKPEMFYPLEDGLGNARIMPICSQRANTLSLYI